MPKCLLAAAAASRRSPHLPPRRTRSRPPPPRLQLTTQQDHKLMMEALKIETLRQGAERHEPQRAERRQLRRVEGQPLPEPARSSDV